MPIAVSSLHSSKLAILFDFIAHMSILLIMYS